VNKISGINKAIRVIQKIMKFLLSPFLTLSLRKSSFLRIAKMISPEVKIIEDKTSIFKTIFSVKIPPKTIN
jgi:hypothetical protein